MNDRNKLIGNFLGDRPGSRSEVSANIPKGDIETINVLHRQIGTYIEKSIQNSLLIGEMLDKKRKELGYGKFKPWFEANNFEFSYRHAKRYLYIHDHRARLEGTRVSLSLREALQLLAESDKESKDEEREINPKRKPEEIYKDFKEGKNLAKEEKQILRGWIQEKVNKLKTKAETLEKEIRKIR